MTILFSSLFISDINGTTVASDVIVGSEAELLKAIEAAPDNTEYVIGLSKDIKLTSSLVIHSGKNITLAGVGSVWKLVGANKQNTINVAGSLTIDGICVTHADGDVGRGVYVESDGIFTMLGGVISGNTVDGPGGGVHVNFGTFVMLGGEITGNTATTGGGVYSVNSVLDRRDGTIWGNTATRAYSGYNDVSQTELTPRVNLTETTPQPPNESDEPTYLLHIGIVVIVTGFIVAAVALLFYRSKKSRYGVLV